MWRRGLTGSATRTLHAYRPGAGTTTAGSYGTRRSGTAVAAASLSASLADDARGFTAESAGPSGVLILNNGHYRGVWHWVDGSYAFTPGGYGTSTHSAATPQDAVRFTLDHVCRQ